MLCKNKTQEVYCKNMAESEERAPKVRRRAGSLDPTLLQRPPSYMTIRGQFLSRSYSDINITKSVDPSMLQRPSSTMTSRNQVLQTNRSAVPQSINSHSGIESESVEITSVPVSGKDEERENNDSQFSSSCIECVIPYRVIDRSEIAVGDHMINAGAVYDHHAIITEIAPDERDENNIKRAKVTLIHTTNTKLGVLSGLSKVFGGKAEIRRTVDYFDFETSKIMIVKYFNAPFKETDIVRRAEGELEKQDFRYHLFGNNCEHFATYCVTNERFSMQVTKLKMTLKMFLSLRFVALSNEKQRNQVAHERGLICKMCFERNNKLFEAEKKPIKEKADVQKGDIITFSYWNLYHDAVVLEVHEDKVKDQKKVDLTFAHYAFCGLSEHRTIKNESKTFSLNGSVTVTMYKSPQFNVYSSEETVERARMRIGEQQFAFFANDSSHFARWCKLKLSHSS